MTVTVASFRQTFPEFASEANFPGPAIQTWITAAGFMLKTAVWGISAITDVVPPDNERDLGICLFVAHNIVLERQAQKSADVNGVPGLNTGPISAKSVGNVSVNYDTANAIAEDAGHWNLTVYGTRFIAMARMMGSFPLQIGAGCAPYGSGGAWPGPWPWPLPGGVGFG